MRDAERVIVGRAIKVSAEQVEQFPELKAHLEETVRAAFAHHYPDSDVETLEWRFEDEHTSTDPATGHEFQIPAEWMLIAEGWV